MKLNIKSKLLISILGATTLIYLFAFGFIIYNNFQDATQMSKKYTDAVAAINAQKVINDIDEDFAKARTLSQGFVKYSNTIYAADLSVYQNILKNFLEKNPRYYAVGLSIELSALDKNYKKKYGRLRIGYINSGGITELKIDTLNVHGDNVESPYYNLKLNPQEDISEPYPFSPYKDGKRSSLISSISVPLLDGNTFIGLIQLDIMLKQYKKMIYNIKPFASTRAFMLSNEGFYISNTAKHSLNKDFEKTQHNTTFNILQKIKDGEHFSYIKTDSTNRAQYYSYYPLKFGNSKNPWSLGVTVPYDDMIKTAYRNLYFSIIALVLGLIIITIITWNIAHSISVPLSQTADTIGKLAQGDISSHHKVELKRSDEIGYINKTLNSLIEGLENNLNFAVEIGEGNLSYDFTPIGDKDVLGNALLEMRKSLKQAEVEDKIRKAEDLKLNWATQGFAKFGELLRENTDNLTEFSYNIISNLVKYLDANQGGLFLINNVDKNNVFIELSASYAYNRRKYIDKKINLGVGLVGRCIDERETIYMTDFPSNYLNISSGLGESQPKSLLLVPIIFNTQVFGVIEIASLHEMKRHEIEFVERIGESMGSTISNVKTNENTAILLEEANIESERLIAQDEQLREQIDKLKSVRNKLNSSLTDTKAVLKAMDDVLLIAEFDMQGRLTDINKKFLNFIGKSRHEVIGMFQGSFAITKEDPRNLFRDFWNELRKGVTKTSYQSARINDKSYELFEAYMPIIGQDEKPYKVINVTVDLTNINEADND